MDPEHLFVGNWFVEEFDREGPNIPAEEQRAIAARLRAALEKEGLPTSAEMDALFGPHREASLEEDVE